MIHRRRFLQNSGVFIALPALEYFLNSKAVAQNGAVGGASGTGTAAKRILYLYIPNGATWDMNGTGPNLTLSPVLSALEPVRDHITVISGLNLPSALDARAGDHARGTAAFLTDFTPAFPGPGVKRSVDHELADVIGKGARYPTLTFGGEPGGGSDNGYAEAYNGNFSWESATAPSTKETNPRAIFQRLFGSSPARSANFTSDSGFNLAPSVQSHGKSILDYVIEEAAALNKELGSADKAKLDEYLTSVRSLESRIFSSDTTSNSGGTPVAPPAMIGGAAPAGGSGGTCTPPASMNGGGAFSYDKNIPLMYDLMHHAFACDLTRVGSFMLANEGSYISYGFAGAARAHHEISHDPSPAGRAAMASVLTWHMTQLANFLIKLKDSGILDSTLVMIGAGMGDGAAHNHDNLAVLVSGKVNGIISGGKHIVARGSSLAKLHITLANALGVNWTSFGKSTGALSLA